MKKRTGPALLLAAALALSGCSSFLDQGGGNEQPTNEESRTQRPSDTSGQEVSYDNIRLPAATAYYLDGEGERTVNACKAIYSAMQEGRHTVDLKSFELTKGSIDPMIMLVVSTAPRLCCVQEGYSYTVGAGDKISALTVGYTVDLEEAAEMDAELLAAAQTIIDEGEGLPDDARAKLYHDRLVRGCEYSDESPNCYSAYGCLVEGKAVCEGYSKAYLLLCELGGLDCLTVLGDTFENGAATPHMWNKLCLDDEWYNVDVTWDDPITTLDIDYIRYDYYNITDAELLRDHRFDDSGYLRSPSAEGTAWSYFGASGLLINEPAEAREIVTCAIADTASRGSDIAEVKAVNEDVYSEVYEELFKGDHPEIFEILDDAAQRSGADFNTDKYTVLSNENQNTITLVLEMGNSE